jgi:hypothetical protein
MNIYTTDGGKIGGRWAYIIDDSVSAASRQIKASSHGCSLHIYPVYAGDSMATSVRHAMEQLFETALLRTSPPSGIEAKNEDLSGVITIKLDEFYPKFNCSAGQHEGYCTATTDISMTAGILDYATGNRKYVNASSQRSADGGSGQMCAGASDVIAESVKKSTKDVLERLGEKLSNVCVSRK